MQRELLLFLVSICSRLHLFQLAVISSWQNGASVIIYTMWQNFSQLLTHAFSFSFNLTCHRFPVYSQSLPLHVNPSPPWCFLLPYTWWLLFPRRHIPLPVPLDSSCQMRTLDSGIGTFPLPDSVTRASGRHIPKSESSPGGVTAGSFELQQEPSSSHPDPLQPDVKVPSLPKPHLHTPTTKTTTTLGHSLSDPTVICSGNTRDTQSRLPKLASSGQLSLKKIMKHISSHKPEFVCFFFLFS